MGVTIMLFKDKNQSLLDEAEQKTRKYGNPKIVIPLIYFFLISSFLVFCFCVFLIDKVKLFDKNITLTIAIIYICIAVLYILKNSSVIKHNRKSIILKKQFKAVPTIEIGKDLSITITKQNGHTTKINKLHKFSLNCEYGESLELIGESGTANNLKTIQCKIPFIMEQQDQLNSILRLCVSTNIIKQFKNNVIQKLFYANEEMRSKEFLKELLDSYFLIPFYLYDDDNIKLNDATLKITDHITIAYEKKDNTIFLYTSYSEMNETTLKKYPCCYSISFIQVLELATQDQASILNSEGSSVMINPNSESIILTKQQVTQISNLFNDATNQLGGY